MKESRVVFKNKNQELVGLLCMPKKRNPPAILMVHGFGVDKDECGAFVEASKLLCENGFAVLRFDFRGSGESEGKHEDMAVTGEVSDLKKAIDFFLKQKIDKKRLGLLALSHGAAVSTVCNDKRIRAFAFWYPVWDFKTTFIDKNYHYRKYRLTDNELKELKSKKIVKLKNTNLKIGIKLWSEWNKINLSKYFKNIRIPILVLHGDADTHVPFDVTRKLFELLPFANTRKQQFKVIKGAEHGFEGYRDTALQLTLYWFEKWLK